MKFNNLKIEDKSLTLDQVFKEAATRPKPIYLYKGITVNSTGLIVGSSKGGKTIFAENLLMHYAAGKREFLGRKLGKTGGKVLFLGLEEFWLERSRRNERQISVFSDSEQALIKENYLYQPIDFLTRIVKNKHWQRLETIIKNSKADIVVIDSITRLNHGDLKDSATAERIMQYLRKICHSNKITLICIHHTPKIVNQTMTIDTIKGSSTFAQESDFAIGIGKTSKGDRYIKDLFYRYAPEDNEGAQEFEITENLIVSHISNTSENAILNRSDARRDQKARKQIIEFFQKQNCKEFTTAQLIQELSLVLSLKERRIKTLLSDLVNDNKIERISNGVYSSIDCVGKEARDEEE